MKNNIEKMSCPYCKEIKNVNEFQFIERYIHNQFFCKICLEKYLTLNKRIIKLYESGLYRVQIAKQLNIPENFVESSLKRNKVNRRKKDKKYTIEEINFLNENYSKLGAKFCAEKLNRTAHSIINKSVELDLYRDYHKTKIDKSLQNEENLIKYKKIMKLLGGAKKRAKEKQIPFELDYEWVKENLKEFCPVLNIKFKFKNNLFGNSRDSSPSLDRYDNNKGYTKENTKIISNRVNNLKKDGTLVEFEKIVEYLKTNLEIPEDYSI